MATVKITPTEVSPPTTCADCGKEPGAYDVTIASPSARGECWDEGLHDGESVVMIAVCTTCIAGLAGQLSGAVFAVVLKQDAPV